MLDLYFKNQISVFCTEMTSIHLCTDAQKVDFNQKIEPHSTSWMSLVLSSIRALPFFLLLPFKIKHTFTLCKVCHWHKICHFVYSKGYWQLQLTISTYCHHCSSSRRQGYSLLPDVPSCFTLCSFSEPINCELGALWYRLHIWFEFRNSLGVSYSAQQMLNQTL